ncbi:FAD:protein FMN transferase [Sphingomonas sp. BK580]|uniref:FAD:protein FMN transferase n=1 Tax=Sphingomonas sp. BK580 TaxID=2586972 RepID=UPI001609642B|nr:FAD:protein FMN transferase [Sphingomonas sp. BK580]MBB3694277.1 thiamine biosynthesis lipoprotein [Sphingomonas sp. BK580]
MPAPRIALPPTIDPAALASHDPAARVERIGGETMGTTWRVRYAGRVAPEAAAAAITARLAALVDQMSHWEPGSALSRFNDAPAGSWHELPADIARVVGLALALAERSGGAFDPAIGALVDAWGFGPAGARVAPGPREIADALALGGWCRLEWDAPRRRLRQPGGVRLDLSGIAKGYAVDAVADLLGELGLRHCLVEIGGELVGRGWRPDGDPWWVDLETPDGAGVSPLRVAAHQLALATSGSYVRGAHNLDPRTGAPPAHAAVSASVIAPTAALADALATIAVVAAPASVMALDYPIRLIVRTNDGYRELLSPRLDEMLTRADR